MKNPLKRKPLKPLMIVLAIVAGNTAGQPIYAADQKSVLAEQTNKERADKLCKEGHYAEAVSAYKQVVQSQPGDAGNYFSLGSCYQELRQYDRARSCYEKAAALKPDDKSYRAALKNLRSIKAAPLVQRGMEKQMHGDYAGAISDYRSALRIDDDPGIHANLAKALSALGKKDEAESELHKTAGK